MYKIANHVNRIYKKYPKLSVLYLLWFSINFVILFVSDKEGASYFYPFQKNTAQSGLKTYYHDGSRPHSLFHAYDYSEFIVYMLTPLLIALIIIMIRKNLLNSNTQKQSKR